MPELPEVETVRRGLEPALAGRRIVRAIARRPDLRTPLPKNFAERLTGSTVLRLRRRAKYILADLDSGETLVIHLGMSGRITIHNAEAKTKPGGFAHKTPQDGSGSGKHDHIVLETDTATRIVYTDHRRFGLMTLLPTVSWSEDALFDELGPEPLDVDFTPAYLATAFKGKKTPLKSALLDQRVVAGLGNIYVCEALFRTGISPKRLAKSLSNERIVRLVPEIKAVLREAIAAGGSSLRDYAHTDGELGYFQHRFRVYDREGEKCSSRSCKSTIKRLVQAGRSTFYCPSCQK